MKQEKAEFHKFRINEDSLGYLIFQQPEDKWANVTANVNFKSQACKPVRVV